MVSISFPPFANSEGRPSEKNTKNRQLCYLYQTFAKIKLSFSFFILASDAKMNKPSECFAYLSGRLLFLI
ncbi:hypothetical protein AB434_3836 [Heyndrickxia coagulans]|uniref:Uncharacterized protein n=1 Tax=Heyndrickxia coagulans TaxID=1398 RepID=A0AAN0T509_HEYCO|nr:hypothetical protein SB48_HM08orf02258 [Heyndrickxia coagulans]AKN56241.1 hypothetical protein AB434_3836 [Heyndrickxia coagulans]KYC92057.1 hypothetical protein B4096_3013 [Heyndrickxia coagulans]